MSFFSSLFGSTRTKDGDTDAPTTPVQPSPSMTDEQATVSPPRAAPAKKPEDAPRGVPPADEDASRDGSANRTRYGDQFLWRQGGLGREMVAREEQIRAHAEADAATKKKSKPMFATGKDDPAFKLMLELTAGKYCPFGV